MNSGPTSVLASSHRNFFFRNQPPLIVTIFGCIAADRCNLDSAVSRLFFFFFFFGPASSPLQGLSRGEFSTPTGPNMHASTSPTQQRTSWQSQRMSSGRSGRSSHASSMQPASVVDPRVSAHEDPQRRRTSTSASTQSSPPKWWRVRLFRGMTQDLKRRAPYYWSDWTDAWDYRIVPATVYMYFAK